MFKRLFRLIRAWFFPTQAERERLDCLMRDAPRHEIRSRMVNELNAGHHIARMIADSERKIERLDRQAARAERDGKIAVAEQLRAEQHNLRATLEETKRVLEDTEESVRLVKETLKQQDREMIENFQRKMEELRRQRDDYNQMPYGPSQPLPGWLNDPAAIMVGILIAINFLLMCILILVFSR